MKTTKEQIIKILEKLPVYEPISDSDIEVAATDIINLLDDPERKQIVWDEKTIKYPFTAAVNAVKSGSHQIEKDCNNLDLLRDVLKEAFPEQTIFEPKLVNLKYFRMHLHVTNNFDNHAGTSCNNSNANLPIIKLSEIMPKEVNVPLMAINAAIEAIERPELNIYQEIDRSIEILKACKRQLKKQAQDKMVDEIKQSVKEFEEKPFELEAEKWYVGIKPDGSKSGYIAFYETVPNRPKKKGVCYGFYKSVWFDRQKRYANNLRLATTEEITEALKAEAIKRGLDKGYHQWDGESYIGVRKSSPEMYLNEEMDCLVYSESLNHVFNKGVWANPIPTITKAEAEEKLNCKIVD